LPDRRPFKPEVVCLDLAKINSAYDEP